MKKIILSVGFCLCLMSGLSYANMSLNGPTGLIMIPSAESIKFKEFNFSYDYGMANKEQDDNWYYKANIGTFQNLELGFIGGKYPSEGAFLNVKYYLTTSEEVSPLHLALGAENILSHSKTNVYMVASKRLRYGIGAHFGFRAIFDEDDVLPTIMAGSNYMVNSQWEVLGDISGTKTSYLVNVGSRYNFNSDIAIRLNVVDLFSQEEVGTLFTLGISTSRFL